MNIRWREFEQSCKRHVRRALRHSPDLAKLRRRARKGRFRRAQLPAWTSHFLFLGLAIGAVFARNPTNEWLVAFLGLWTLSMACYRAAELPGAIYAPEAVNVLGNLPCPDRQIFRRQWSLFLRKSLWTAVDVLAICGAVMVMRHLSWDRALLALMLGLLPWIFATVTGVALAEFLPFGRLFAWASVVLGLCTFALLIFGTVPPQVMTLLALPGAWLTPLPAVIQGMSSEALFPAGQWAISAGVFLIALIFSRAAFVRARKRFHVSEEPLFVSAFIQSSRRGYASAPAQWAEPFKRNPGEAANSIRTNAFLQGLDWTRLGVLERVFVRFLTPRERLVAEFLVAGKPGWSVGVFRSVLFLFVVMLAFWLFPLLKHVGFVVLFGVFYLLVGLLGGWHAMACPSGSGPQAPFYALHPVGFGECARVIAKINFLRLAVFLPVFLVMSHVLSLRLGFGEDAPITVERIAILFLLLLPGTPIFSFSPTTDDTRRFLVIAAVLGAVLTLLGLSLAFLFVKTTIAVLLTGAAVGVFSWATTAAYGWLFNRSSFDLVPPVRPGSQQ